MSKDGNYTLEYHRGEIIQCMSSQTGMQITITKTNETGSFTSKS